ncbi:mannose-1-phosphate guanylyltransferase/mannose-6-phosphate isomerase [Amaricoccus sp.]|uniref:mannose-1-phosphate guanylyltransferase/mannose-6-phosphate isomerase n=1 Tax=Amaricoccus sp. TaxID=1872485 RepID=UPI001B7446D0|nr:mannose-1-phosphate guanylyltransferase/mannose-6-phosphate isomerase [Amaricoccus sp.]MBP7003122.1 mannose-1-phosphate guanylyltransferase/mannose-6-phosphate isomerase [Amaricoccus sp.]
MRETIVPVILGGGAGTRLWPLSRARRPKQFARLVGETSLFQAAVLRLPEPEFAPPVVVAGEAFRFLVTEQLAGIGRAPAAVILEPEGRNTAAATLAAALVAAGERRDPLLLVCPSDHVLPDAAGFRAAVRAGVAAARAGALVTFGVRPTRAETGYGWLELDALPAPGGDPAALPLRGFVEKPEAGLAGRLLASGRHLWNSGVFLFSAAAIRAVFAEQAPELARAVEAAVAGAVPDLAFLRLDPAAWAAVESVALDRAIMEKAPRRAVVPIDGPWSDLGAWDAVARAAPADADGVTLQGPAHALGCRDSLLRAESPDQVLVGVGLRGVVAIAMRDAVLVADKAAGQRVGEAVALLKAGGVAQATEFPRTHRPWGWYETLARGPRFQVKRIMVHPGAALSLQSHVHRAEHWVVVEGAARVTLGSEVRLLGENQSAYVPPGATHRLENPGKVDLHLIEVQSGPYLGEDDITRYADAYARV